MSTGLTDEDWDVAVGVFRAVRSRGGDKGRDDRKFLESSHYFTVNSVTWRSLPAEYGPRNSVWKRFWRLSKVGVFEAFFEALAGLSETAHLVQMFDSTVVRVYVSAVGTKGGSPGRRSAAHGAVFPPRSISRPISTASPSPLC